MSDRICSGFPGGGEEPDIVMIDATRLKARRTACRIKACMPPRSELANKRPAHDRQPEARTRSFSMFRIDARW